MSGDHEIMSETIDFPNMRDSTHGEGLRDFIKELPENIVMAEIGCYLGDSTLIFLETGKISKMFCVDPWENGYDDKDTSSFTIPMEIVHDRFLEQTIKYQDQITIMRMKSEDACHQFENESLDMVYIDGNHIEEYVEKDVLAWYPKIKQDGIIAGHDFYEGNIIGKTILKIFDKIDKTFIDSSWMKIKK